MTSGIAIARAFQAENDLEVCLLAAETVSFQLISWLEIKKKNKKKTSCVCDWNSSYYVVTSRDQFAR